jgi:hypothetical protein
MEIWMKIVVLGGIAFFEIQQFLSLYKTAQN